MNIFTKQKYSHRKQTYGYQGIKGGRVNWEIGLTYTHYRNYYRTNKKLLTSTGNST